MNVFEHYQKEKQTINLRKANIVGLSMIIPIIILFSLPFYLIWRGTISFSLTDLLSSHLHLGYIIVFVVILGVIVHELIHGITWAIFAKKGFRSISFGVKWKAVTPYCHCDEPMPVRHYALGLIMPAILLGFIPALVAIAIGNVGLLAFGIYFTMTACGDFLIIYTIRKEEPDTLVEDHPSEVGCYVYRKIIA